jgi:hypothetical protein
MWRFQRLSWKSISDPRFIRQKLSHDYYCKDPRQGVRPGGLIAFITSRYTMDEGFEDPGVHRGGRPGAIRLRTAFCERRWKWSWTLSSGKRRPDGGFLGVTKEPNCSGQKVTDINEYYPQFRTSRHPFEGSMYRENEYTVDAAEIR